jgi:hypothetical protein
MPRMSAPEEFLTDDTITWPSTMGVADFTPGTVMRLPRITA